MDETATLLATSFKYDAARDKWTSIKSLPIPMSHYSPNTIVRNGRIYLFGGEQQFNVESTQVLEYDPAKNSYKTLTPLPVARAAAMAGLIGDKFIYSGGKNAGWKRETYIGTFA